MAPKTIIRTTLAIVLVLVALMIAIWLAPAPAQSVVPVQATVLPQSAFRPVRPVDLAPEATTRPVEAPSAVPGHRPAIRTIPRPSRAPRPAQPLRVIPKPRLAARTSHAVSGVATWYCEPGVSICTNGFPASGAYGAAGPALRAALGNWRGRTVYVNGVAVTLIDWCGCPGNHVIDVYHGTWVTIPSPSWAVVRW
jgi:hypothetical protein